MYSIAGKKKETLHEYFLPCRSRVSITPIYQNIGNPKPHIPRTCALSMRSLSKARSWWPLETEDPPSPPSVS